MFVLGNHVCSPGPPHPPPPPPPPCRGIQGRPGGEPDGAEQGWGEFRELGSGRRRSQPPGLFLSVGEREERKSRLSVFVCFAKTRLCLCDTHVRVCDACIVSLPYTHTHTRTRSDPPGQQIAGHEWEMGRSDVMERCAGVEEKRWQKERRK